jgi:Putative addiction module component
MIGVMARKPGLTAEEKKLVRKLGPPPGGPQNAQEWERELNRRLDEIVQGTVKTVDAREATERVFAKLRRRRGGH